MLAQAVTVLADSDQPAGRYSGINPTLNAVVVFVVFMVLLFLTTRLNRDK